MDKTSSFKGGGGSTNSGCEYQILVVGAVKLISEMGAQATFFIIESHAHAWLRSTEMYGQIANPTSQETSCSLAPAV